MNLKTARRIQFNLPNVALAASIARQRGCDTPVILDEAKRKVRKERAASKR